MMPAGPEPAVFEVFEEYVLTRENDAPPVVDEFIERLPDESSKTTFAGLVDSYHWTQKQMPRNVLPNVVLAIMSIGRSTRSRTHSTRSLSLGRVGPSRGSLPSKYSSPWQISVSCAAVVLLT